MISEKLYYDALAYMKMNGALFFEMYFDKTTTHNFELLAGCVTQKTDSHCGVSVRSFDGNRYLFISTDDLSENNLWNIIRDLAKQSTKGYPQKFFNGTFEGDSVRTVNCLYDWSSSQDDVLKVLMEEHDAYNSINKIKHKSNCFIQEQEIKILSSYNGVICDKRSRCCIKTDVESMDGSSSNISKQKELQTYQRAVIRHEKCVPREFLMLYYNLVAPPYFFMNVVGILWKSKMRQTKTLYFIIESGQESRMNA